MYAKLMLALSILAYAVVGRVAVAGQTTPVNANARASQAEAVGLVRTINTAELDPWFKTHAYVSLEELLQRRFLRGTGNAFVLSDASSGGWKGYVVSVVASADGKHYLLGLAPGSGCGFSVFSNESGVIYTGRALGCPPFERPAESHAQSVPGGRQPSKSR
ncbi:MAG: hypothetical protein ACRD3T_04915 [Terriglobia bacterium]